MRLFVLAVTVALVTAKGTKYDGEVKCGGIDSSVEQALIDQDALSEGFVSSASVVSEGSTFEISSVIDDDKHAEDACLTGRSGLSNRNTDEHPTLTATLPQSYDVCGVVLSGRPDWPNDRMMEGLIAVSADKSTWTSAKDRMNDDSETFIALEEDGGDFYYTLLFDVPISGQYLKLESTKIVPGAAAAFRVGALYNCEYLDRCAGNGGAGPCKNGGACTSLPFGRFSCECAEGFSGPTCEDEATPAATPLGCSIQMRDARFDYFDLYEPIYVSCPAGDVCKVGDPMWGDPTRYTTDSPICKAAIHAFGPDYLTEGKTLTVYKVGDFNDYAMSFRNGIFSLRYTKWWAAYTFDPVEMEKYKAANPA